jgi:hypothetical protein
VCLWSLTEWCEPLSTCRRLARCPGWNHIPFPRPRAPPAPHVSGVTGSRINLVPVQRISPGVGRTAQSGAGHWSGSASTIHGRSSAGKSSKRGLSGNFGRGLRKVSTTRRPCRQGEPADFPTRGYDQ